MATSITAITASKPLGNNARQVASKRYSLKNDSGQATEDWDAIVERVVSHVAAAETDSLGYRYPTEKEQRLLRIAMNRRCLPMIIPPKYDALI
ncbi:MAG: hypothetical protein QOH70_2098 [Blastocatellia bacterium]|jgi:hypothetical protein|nr:hypothetical protein [Blastocatellia bacterium]